MASHTGSAPDVVAPPPGNPRFPLIDALRAVAALTVLASHVIYVVLAPRVPGIFGALGTSGVTIFFVISGFVLYRPYAAAHLDMRTGPALRDYARRRLLRILPAYWLALTLLSIYPGLVGNFGRNSWVYYLLLQDWFPHLQYSGLPPAWTLSVEVTWYVMLPLIAASAWQLARLRRPRSPLFAEVAMLGVLVAIRLLYEVAGPSSLGTAFYFLDWFVAGVALAVASAAVDRRPATPRVIVMVERYPELCWLAAFGAYCTYAFRLAHHAPTFANHVTQAVFAMLVVSPAVFVGSRRSVVHAVLRHRVLAWLGLISYGLYLWQAPIVLKLSSASWIHTLPFAQLLTLSFFTLVLTVVCAAASYYFVERPILRLKRNPARAEEPQTSGRATRSTLNV